MSISNEKLEKAVFHLIEVICNYEDDNVSEEEGIGIATDLINNLTSAITSDPISLLGRCIRTYRDRH